MVVIDFLESELYRIVEIGSLTTRYAITYNSFVVRLTRSTVLGVTLRTTLVIYSSNRGNFMEFGKIRLDSDRFG